MAMGWLKNNSQGLTQAGIGLLTGRNPQEQFAMGAQGFMQGQQQNKTAQYIEQNFPELGQAVKAGVLSPADAFKMATEAKTKKAPLQINGKLVDPETYQVVADFSEKKAPSYDFKTLPDGTYGNYDQTTGQFSPLGNAPKSDDFSVRQQQAQELGMSPQDPRYQSFILTGKFPREDAQPLTATDKKAILEADEMVLATQGAIPLIDRALQLNDQAYSGPTAGIRGMIGGNLGMDSGQATMELDNVVASQALGQLKAIFGAAPTEGERKILLDLQGSVSQPPEVRKAIFERAKVAAQRRLDFYQQRANEMRGGEYYKPGGAANQGNRTATGATWSVVE
jgi:hypothetical protein